MSEFILQAKQARETLARALGALQSDPTVPPALMSVAEPVAQAMGALHAIERTGNLSTAPNARDHVRSALGMLQAQSGLNHVAIANAMEAVAGSLGIVFGLVRANEAQASTPQAAPSPQAAPQAAAQPAYQAPAQPAPQPAYQPPPQQAYPQQPAPQQPAFQQPPAQAFQQPPAQPAFQQPPAQAFQQPPAQPAFQQPPAQPAPQPSAAAYTAQVAQTPVQPPPAAAPSQPVAPAPPPQPAAVAAPPAAAPSQPAQPRPASSASSDPFAPPPKPAADAGGGPARFEAALGINSPTNFYKGLSGNDVVEHGGIFIATYSKVPRVGTPVALRVILPGGYEFESMASVAWIREHGDSDQSPGFGARFTQISPESKQLIYRYVRNREPLFHDDL